MSANTLVNFVWNDEVPADVRRQPFLTGGVAGQAQKVVVPNVPEVEVADDRSAGQGSSPAASRPRNDGEGSNLKKPKWLQGFGKK